MLSPSEFRFGFRVLGDCRQPRRPVDAAAALFGYSECDERAELQRESYLSAFQFAADFRANLSATGSLKGFAGACWSPWIWIDVDAAGDLPAALDTARRLGVLLTDSLGVRDDDALIFFSGSKGFHVGIPSALWTPDPGGEFHRVAKCFAAALAERVVATIDAGVYDRVRCFRAPNSRHPKTGLHKRRLSVGELMHLSAERIIELAVKPKPFELPAPQYRSEPAAALWAEAAERARRDAEAAAQRRAALADGRDRAKLNRRTLEFIRAGAAEGHRHRLLFSAARNLAEFGCPQALAHALLTDAALDCGLSPSDVRRQIECGLADTAKGDFA